MFRKESAREAPRLLRSARLATCWVAAIAALLALCSPAPAAKLEVLHEFTGPDGSDPQGGLTVNPDTGTLYGTAIYGGAGYGTVFSLTPPLPGKSRWKFKVIYTFKGGADGSQPATGLVFLNDDAGLHLIGTTLRGSSFCDCGTIFELDNVSGAWEKIASHQFQGDTYDGGLPNSTPVFDPKTKTVFGTTGSSGNDSGSIYGLDPYNFDFTVIYNPAQHIGTSVGTSPFGVAVDSDDGLLLGTALKSDYAGTIFLMDFQGAGEILHEFKGPPMARILGRRRPWMRAVRCMEALSQAAIRKLAPTARAAE